MWIELAVRNPHRKFRYMESSAGITERLRTIIIFTSPIPRLKMR
jgi:hypothetical protein